MLQTARRINTLPNRIAPFRHRQNDTHAICISHAVQPVPEPFRVFRKSSCPCGGGCPTCQGKSNDLRVSQPNDPAEIEADQIADQIMRMAEVDAKPVEAASKSSGAVHRKENANSAPVRAAQGVFGSSGHPMDAETRDFFEPRFGRDLGDIRIHTGNATSQTAEEISALAYTVGTNIGFATGSYDPLSHQGKRLIAHELAHVVQQENGTASRTVHRKFTPQAGQEGFDSKDSTGQSTFHDKDGVVSEFLDRRDRTGMSITSPIYVEFDKNKCTVRSTMSVNFVKTSDPKKGVTDEEFATTKERFFRVANEKLNGWVAIEVGEGDKCTACAGKMLPVKIEVNEGSGPNSSTVTVAKTGNVASDPTRADSGTLLPNSGDSTHWHEAGHIVLGADDEYEEKDPTQRQRPKENVNPGDNSAMDDHYKPHSVFHARHFVHISNWLGRKFPGCSFETKELRVYTGLDVRIPFGGYLPTAGFANVGGSSGAFLNYGVDLGIPLTNIADWDLFVGAHGTFLAQLEGDKRMAFLVGARIGVEKMWTPREGGFNLGGFAESGVSLIGDREAGDADMNSSFRPGGYGYGGLNLGYKLPSSILNMSFNAEIGGGIMGAPGLHNAKDFTKDEKLLPFFTAGLRAAWMF